MDSESLKAHLCTMSQDEVINHLLYTVKEAKSLKVKTDKAEISERLNIGSKTATARSWNNSEQFEKRKEEIRIIVKHLH